MSTRILARLIFSSSKYRWHRKCNSFKNCVALLPGFRDCHFDGSFSSNVRYVTCSHRTYCHAESRAGRVQCFKMAKVYQVLTFYPTFWLKKATFQWENEPLGCKYLLLCVRNWKCLHNYRRPTMKIPDLRWCLTEMSFNNPSQFPYMF